MKPEQLRRNILEKSYLAGACHLGSALSCVEILLALEEVKKDYFIFAKASGVAAYYCLKGKDADTLKNYPLPSKEAGLIHSLGSVGHGLSVAAGIAFADRTKKVYCLISDGELNEGSTWEALLFAGHHKLNNLCVIVDYNRIQACGHNRDILNLEPLDLKFESFNWQTKRLNGHKISSEDLTLDEKYPLIIIAETIKGKGVNFLEDSVDSHYKNLDQELLIQAINQL